MQIVLSFSTSYASVKRVLGELETEKKIISLLKHIFYLRSIFLKEV